MHSIRAFDARCPRPYLRSMSRPDLNLLVALDLVLEEMSVVSAARRMDLSPSAMSRTLARLRVATGDPLLVKAGRKLVPTPRAVALRDQVGRLVGEAESVLRPVATLDPSRLRRTFTLRTSDGFVERFGPALLARVSKEAPLVRLTFLQKPDKESTRLREGEVDLETGVIATTTGDELRTRPLFKDRFVGVVRAGHPFGRRRVTLSRYVSARHVSVTRGGRDNGPVDRALTSLGIERIVAASVGGFAAAIALARGSDLVATVPERQTDTLRRGMQSFTLPFPVPELTVSLLWHPRLDADLAHRWLRGVVREICVAGRSANRSQER